jgi:hypothetical protein
LAHVLVSKYADHLPLYRQAQTFARQGLDIDRSTLAGWVGKSAALLEPLAEAIRRHVLSGQAIFADDTPVKMLAPGNGKTKTTRSWAYDRHERPWGSDVPPAAWYQFTPDRKGIRPSQHLKDYQAFVVPRMAMPGSKSCNVRAKSKKWPWNAPTEVVNGKAKVSQRAEQNVATFGLA